MLAVPRHEFVPENRRGSAYEDRPLPIGEGQTISAPHMVAMMTDLLALDPGERVLEIGTGCGYHAAVTAEIVDGLRSVEYHEPLAVVARERLARLGYEVDIRVGDGHEGWPEGAPYDAAYLTCAAPEIPAAVVRQVRPGGANRRAARHATPDARARDPAGRRRTRYRGTRRRAVRADAGLTGVLGATNSSDRSDGFRDARQRPRFPIQMRDRSAPRPPHASPADCAPRSLVTLASCVLIPRTLFALGAHFVRADASARHRRLIVRIADTAREPAAG